MKRNVIPGLTRNLFQRKKNEGEIPGRTRYDSFVGELIQNCITLIQYRKAFADYFYAVQYLFLSNNKRRCKPYFVTMCRLCQQAHIF